MSYGVLINYIHQIVKQKIMVAVLHGLDEYPFQKMTIIIV